MFVKTKNTMTEIIKEIFGLYKEKTKLPVISTYIFVLIIWNWDILSIYIFSKANIETKICWIKNISENDYYFRILVPIVIASLYPIVSHLLTLGIDYSTKKIKTKIQKMNFDLKISKADNLFKIEEKRNGKRSIEELRTINESLQLSNDNLTNQLQQANTEIETMNDALITLNNQNQNLVIENNNNSRLSSDLDSTRKKLEETNRELEKVKIIYSNLTKTHDILISENKTLSNRNSEIESHLNVLLNQKNTSNKYKKKMLYNLFKNANISFYDEEMQDLYIKYDKIARDEDFISKIDRATSFNLDTNDVGNIMINFLISEKIINIESKLDGVEVYKLTKLGSMFVNFIRKNDLL